MSPFVRLDVDERERNERAVDTTVILSSPTLERIVLDSDGIDPLNRLSLSVHEDDEHLAHDSSVSYPASSAYSRRRCSAFA